MSLVGFKAQNHPQQVSKDHVDDRALPDGEFFVLNRRFNFSIDAAASVRNARLPRFWTKETNARAKEALALITRAEQRVLKSS